MLWPTLKSLNRLTVFKITQVRASRNYIYHCFQNMAVAALLRHMYWTFIVQYKYITKYLVKVMRHNCVVGVRQLTTLVHNKTAQFGLESLHYFCNLCYKCSYAT